MAYTDARISKVRNYLYKIIDDLVTDKKYEINADWLGNIDSYSLDRLPDESKIPPDILGGRICQDTYTLRTRKAYSSDIINNLKNIGFFEDFEKAIYSNNAKGIRPEIEGIQSIECLNSGSLNIENGTEAIFNIQIRIQYYVSEEAI